MNPFYITFVLALLFILLVVVFFSSRRKKSLPVNLYFDALRKENMGEYEQAEKGYQAALEEVGKFRFHDDLKLKIEEKIRLMHTVLEYKQNISFSAFNEPVSAK